MIVAIPYVATRADFAKLPASFRKYDCYQNDILLVTHTSEDTSAATEFFNQIKDPFRRAFMVRLPSTTGAGIQVANTHFSTAAKWASTYTPAAGEVNDPPFLYLDPAYIPAKSDWTTELQTLYYKSPGRTLGRPESQPDITRDIPGGTQVIPGGIVFQGPIVIDKGFATRSALLNFVHPTALWRTSLRFELAASYTESDLVAGGYFELKPGITVKVEPKETTAAAPPVTNAVPDPAPSVSFDPPQETGDGFTDVFQSRGQRRKATT